MDFLPKDIENIILDYKNQIEQYERKKKKIKIETKLKGEGYGNCYLCRVFCKTDFYTLKKSCKLFKNGITSRNIIPTFILDQKPIDIHWKDIKCLCSKCFVNPYRKFYN